MRRLALLLFLLPFFFPVAGHAASVDLGVWSKDISFSAPLVAGDRLRLYASVHNEGEEDVSGYVSFFQGAAPIGDSQVISVRAGGVPEEVYVDFVVPAGSFNIRAEIRGTDPEDQNPDNDVAFTKLFTPILDDDRDGIANEDDLCPSVKDRDQKDSDADGAGDACDTDDDNDGVSDEVEEENGSSPTKADTDGDGVSDRTDAYPTDPSRTQIPPPAPVPAPTVTQLPVVAQPVVATKPLLVTENSKPEERPISESTNPTPDAEAVPVAELPPEEDLLFATGDLIGYSSNAVFRFTRLKWDTFSFAVLVPEVEGQRVSWTFGDGTTSNKREPSRAFTRPGDFTVKLEVTNPDGSISKGETVVTVPFWTLENPLILLLVGSLGILFFIGILLFLRLLFARRSAQAEEMGETEEFVMDEASENELSVDTDDSEETDLSET